MNISYNWLKRYVDTDLGAEEVARILTDIGLEVEGFETVSYTHLTLPTIYSV